MELDFDKVTRVEVVGDGREYVRHGTGVWADLQDHGRTLKIFIDPAPATASDLTTVAAMQRFGGSFVKALAEAWLRGDATNRLKIQETWPEYWAHYTDMAGRENSTDESNKPA